jgi:hypothetical protein
MSDNKDIAVLAKKVYELSILPIADLDARKWEALLILNAVYSSALPEGVAKANADKEARWGDAIRKDGPACPACTRGGTCAPTTANRPPPASPSRAP